MQARTSSCPPSWRRFHLSAVTQPPYPSTTQQKEYAGADEQLPIFLEAMAAAIASRHALRPTCF